LSRKYNKGENLSHTFNPYTMFENLSVSLSFVVGRNKKVKYHIRMKIHKLIVLKF